MSSVSPAYIMTSAKPKLPEYEAEDKSFDECLLENIIFKLSHTFLVDDSKIRKIADLTERLAEPCYGSASHIVKYMAAVEYINVTFGTGIDSFKMLSDFYEEFKTDFSPEFFDLLAYVAQRELWDKGFARGKVIEAMKEESKVMIAGAQKFGVQKSSSYMGYNFIDATIGYKTGREIKYSIN